MTPLHDDLLLGIDAGGTKTLALLADRRTTGTDAPRGTGQGGPGNVRAVGFDAATGAITAAVHAAFANAGIAVGPVAALCLSSAGAGRKAEQQQLQAWADAQNLARRIIVTNDAEPILAAAAPDRTGIAVISGTGSLAWGRNAKGQVERVGGWGYVFGDEGSGYAIAIAGLRAVAQATDGIRGPTALLNAVLDRLDVAHATDLIPRIYGAGMPREQIAALADIVFAAAPHDATARNILAVAADDLARMVTTLARTLSFEDPTFPLAVAGGVLVHQPQFREEIAARLGRPGTSIVPVTCPAVGAVQMARSLT